MKKLIAFALAFAMVLSLAACGSSSSTGGSSASDINIDTSENAITDLVTYETAAREVESLNVLYSQNATDFYVSTNLQDGLLTNDPNGELVACLAESWETTDNGLTWTFHLREDAVWVDQNGEKMADITSADFVTGLEWVLNAAKNQAANTSMPSDMIKGAAEYYEYTSNLSEEEASALAADNEEFLNTVGIETPDDYTVVYHCTAEYPYFDTVATYACLYPAPAALIEELGVEGFRGCTAENMWYSGPYVLTEFISGNEKVFEPNPLWWGNDENTRFNSVTVKMVDDLNVAYQLYQNGEIDNVDLSESVLSEIYSDESSEYYSYLSEKLPTKYSFQMHLVFNKLDKDGNPDVNWNTAVANENFRLSWYYGLNLTSFYARTNAVNPLSLENNCYTMKGLVYTSDGTDYTDLVLKNLGLGDSDGTTPIKVNADLAAQYKEAAIEELTALGVTFPVEVDYYISSASQTALDSATVLAQCFADSLGEDYVKLNIKTYASSLSKEVRTPQLASFYINGWGADYGDPENYLFQETIGDDNAYYSAVYSRINDFYGDDAIEAYDDELVGLYETYTQMVSEANAINDDMDARYTAFAEAEAFLIQHCLGVIPCYYDIEWQLTKVNDYSKINGVYGIQSQRYLNWETNVNGYTTEDYETFAAAANG